MAKSIGFAVLVVLAVSVSGPGRAFAVRCDPGADAAALAAVWDDTDAHCPCVGVASHGIYVKCAGAYVKAAVAAGTLPSSCKKAAKQRASLSICGRPDGAVVCCRTMSNGTVKGQIASDFARCRAPANGEACVAPSWNVVDGCSAAGCVGCGNGVIEPGETCEPPGVGNCTANCQVFATCGNGVVEVGETCEPPGSAGCTDSCVAATCDAPPSGEVAVACLASETFAVPVGAGAGGYLVGWVGRGTPDTNVLRVRRLDAAASPIDPLPTTLTDPADPLTPYNPLIAGDPGGWYVGYQRSLYPQWSMDGLHVASNGTVEARHSLGSGSSFGQCQTGSSGPSAVAAEGDGQFAVAVTDYGGCFLSFVFYGHRTSRVAIDAGIATVTSLGAPDPLVIPPTGTSLIPIAMAHAGADTAAVVTHTTFDGSGNVTDQAVEAHWLPVPGGIVRLSSSATVASSGVAAAGSDDAFLAAWAAIPAPGDATQVRTLRFTHAGGALDPDGGVVAASGVSPRSRPEVVFDGTNWLVAWLDGPSAGPGNVLGVRIAPDGTVLDATPRVLAAGVAQTLPSLTSRGSGWLLSVLRPAGAGLWSVNVVPISP